jgi:hypothetical protein
MKKFSFGVGGGSPGIGGVIVVLAKTLRRATTLAEAELAYMNKVRQASNMADPMLVLEVPPTEHGEIELPAVVFSYDGEM